MITTLVIVTGTAPPLMRTGQMDVIVIALTTTLAVIAPNLHCRVMSWGLGGGTMTQSATAGADRTVETEWLDMLGTERARTRANMLAT
jgi:hypothetical protein